MLVGVFAHIQRQEDTAGQLRIVGKYVERECVLDVLVMKTSDDFVRSMVQQHTLSVINSCILILFGVKIHFSSIIFRFNLLVSI